MAAVDFSKVVGGVAALAVSEDEGAAAHVVMSRLAVLDAADKRMAGLAGDRRWISISTATGRDGVFDFLIAAAVTGLAVRPMGGVNISEGATGVTAVSGSEVAGDGAIGVATQKIMAAVGIVAGNACVTGSAAVACIDFRYVVACGAADQGDGRFCRVVAGVAPLNIVKAIQ